MPEPPRLAASPSATRRPGSAEAPRTASRADSARPAPQHFQRGTLGLLFVAYAALAIVWYGEAWVAPLTHWIGAGGDPLDAMWYLAWIPHAISHGQNPLFTTAMNYPHGVNVAWDTSIPLLAVLAWPVTATGGPILAYNVCMTVGLASTGLAMAVLVRRWVSSPPIAAVAAAVFMLAPYFAGQSLWHLFAVAAPVVPLTGVWLDWAVIHQPKRPWLAGLALGGLLGAELLISEELALSCALVLGLAGLWMALLAPRAIRSRLPRLLPVGLGAAVAFAALGGPLLWWQLTGPGAIHGPVMAPTEFSANLVQFVLPGQAQLLYQPAASAWLAPANPVETGAYLGPAVIVALAFAAWRLRRLLLARVLTALIGTLAALILGPNLRLAGTRSVAHLPTGWLWHLPFVGDLLPLRLSLYLDLAVVLLLAIALDRARRTPWRTRAWIGAALVITSWLPLLPFPANAYPVPAAFQRPWRPHGEVILLIPFAQNVNSARPLEWQAMARLSFSMVDGYYTRTAGARPWYHGPPFNLLTWDLWTVENNDHPPHPLPARDLPFRPIAYWLSPPGSRDPRARPLVTPTLRHFVARYLTYHGVTEVVLGPTAHHAVVERFLVQIFGAPTRRSQGVVEWDRPPPGWNH